MHAIQKNLISVSQLTKDNNVFMEFHPSCCFVKDKMISKMILKGILKDGSCSNPRARPDPVGGSEPKPRGRSFNYFYSHFIMFSFSKVSRPESPTRPEGQIRTGARFTPTASFILTNIYLCYIILGFRLHGSIFK